MKKLIVLLTASLMFTLLNLGHAQNADFDALSASDINTDGIVNILDLTLIATQFNQTAIETQQPNPDINRDGVIDILDLTLAASHFGRKSGFPFEVTDANFDEIVLDAELPTVVEFKSDSCGFCLLMKPTVAAVALQYRETFKIVKLDVDTQSEKTAEYQISGTPTYIVFKEGEVIKRFAGAMSRPKLAQQILEALDIENTDENGQN